MTNYGSIQLEPHRLGWLRRRELDQLGIEVWETPDGELYAHDPKQGRLKIAVFKCLKEDGK
jgi:hypothetical protein